MAPVARTGMEAGGDEEVRWTESSYRTAAAALAADECFCGGGFTWECIHRAGGDRRSVSFTDGRPGADARRMQASAPGAGIFAIHSDTQFYPPASQR